MKNNIAKALALIMASLLLIACNKDDDELETNSALWEDVLAFDSGLYVNNIQFTDSLNIWISATPIPDMNPIPDIGVHIFKSSDGGKTWDTFTIPGTKKLIGGVCALDKNTAIVKIASKGLYKTTNGGSNWTLINEDRLFSNPNIRNSFKFFNSSEGLGVVFLDTTGTDNDTLGIIRTVDGGIHWTKVNYSGENESYSGVEIGYSWELSCKDDAAILFANNSRSFISNDRGVTWSMRSYGTVPGGFMRSMVLVSPDKIAFTKVGRYDNILMDPFLGRTMICFTDNGGNTWQCGSLGINGSSISHVPGKENTFIATGYVLWPEIDGGTSLSQDNCRNFTEIDPDKKNIGAAAFYSIHHGIGVTFNYNEDPTKDNQICLWNPEMLNL